MTRRTVVITGPHRSGTSCVAGMLAAGTSLVFGRVNRQYMADNPRGNYENADVVELNEELIGGWKTPRVPRDVSRETLERIKRVVEQEYPDVPGVIYAIKDPRFLFTLELWRPYLGWIMVLYVHRDPSAVVESMIRREKSIYGRDMSVIEACDILGKYRERGQHTGGGLIHFDNPDVMLAELKMHIEAFPCDFDPGRSLAFYSPTLVHH